MAEQGTHNPLVAGSSPAGPTRDDLAGCFPHPAFFMPPNSRFILSLCNNETNIQATDIMERRTKVLALVAHDNMKHDLAEWVDWNSKKLGRHHLVCTGRSLKRSTVTAVPCGISSYRNSSIFSRTTSATSAFSGMSVYASSGK